MRLEVLPVDRWAGAVAADLASALAAPGARICLPSGTTPVPVYERVPAALAALGADAGGATIVLLDEYLGLAPDDPALAERQLRARLIGRLDPAPAFVAIDVAGDPHASAAALDAAVAGGLDLAVVGLGANGHVGMNEPGSAADAPTRVVELASSTAATATDRYGAASPPTTGITVGLTRLLGAHEVWLLVTGAGKAAILRDVLEGPIAAERPASFLRRHPRLRVIVDAPAAALLTAVER